MDQITKLIQESKLLTAQIHNNVFNHSTLKSLKTASLDESYDFPIEEDKFHAYFLIKGKEINGNEWSVPNDSIDKNIQSFEGRPFLVTADEFIENSPYKHTWMHPNIEHFKNYKPELVAGLDPEKLEDVLKFQDNWKVGDIKKVLYDEEDDYWKAIIQPLPEYEHMVFPPFASPGIFKDNKYENDKNITGWQGVHLVGLKDRPAYGSQAIYEGSCTGTLSSCTKKFSDTKSLFETELKLTRGKIATLLSTDNTVTNVVPVYKKRKKYF